MPDRQTRAPFTSNKLRGEEDLRTNWEAFLYQDSSLKKFNDIESIGYGMERCLYELNPELACLSPSLMHASALTPAEALIALEAVAAQPNRPSFPVDRHLAAFLMSRWKGLSFIDVRDMGKPQREVKNLAVLKILASVQTHFKIKGLPNLCQWMAEICAPMITHYHNLKERARVQEEMARAISTGQLIKLVRIFENRQALVEDHSDYQAAKIEVLLIESEIKEIESRMLNLNRPAFKVVTGISGKLERLWSLIRSARGAKKGKLRITQLYHQSENLLELWGDGLLPRGRNSSLDFWRKLWIKMNAPKSLPKTPHDRGCNRVKN